MTADEVPFAIGEVYGYRYWDLSETGHLVSVTHSEYTWQHGVNEAVCALTAIDEPRAPDPPVRWEEARMRHVVPARYETASVARLGEFNADKPRRLPSVREGRDVQCVPSETFRKHLREAEPGDIKSAYEKAMEAYHEQVAEYEAELAEHRRQAAEHIAPMEDCHCGFYVVRHPDTAKTYSGPTSVLGVVKAYGRMVPMERGWRVGKAEIVALAPVSPDQRPVLEGRMRWEFEPQSEFEVMSAFGLPVTISPPREVRLVPNDNPPLTSPVDLMRKNYPDAEFTWNTEAMHRKWSDRVTEQ